MDSSEMSLAVAFAAGMVSFASPCVLPLVPVYMAMLTGAGEGEEAAKWRFIVNGVFFMLGFTLVFMAMGATASLLGQLFLDYQDILRKVGGGFIILMGLQLAGVLRLPGLGRNWRWSPGRSLHGPLGAFLLGLAFTAGWTPCIGPILAAILAYAGMAGEVSRGLYLLLAYSAGFALPFLVFSFFCQRYLTQARALYRWLPVLQRMAGAILVISGIMLYLNWFQRVLGIILGG